MAKKNQDLCSNVGLYKPHPSSLTSDNYVEQTKNIHRGKQGSFARYYELLHGQVVRKLGVKPSLTIENPIHGRLNYYIHAYNVTRKHDVSAYKHDGAISGLNLYFSGQEPFKASGAQSEISNKDYVFIKYNGAKATITPNIYELKKLSVQTRDKNKEVTASGEYFMPFNAYFNNTPVIVALAHPTHKVWGQWCIPCEYRLEYRKADVSDTGEVSYGLYSCYLLARVYKQTELSDGTFKNEQIGTCEIGGNDTASWEAGIYGDTMEPIYKSIKTTIFYDWLIGEFFTKKIISEAKFGSDNVTRYSIEPKASYAKYPKVRRPYGKNKEIDVLKAQTYTYDTGRNGINHYVKTVFWLLENGELFMCDGGASSSPYIDGRYTTYISYDGAKIGHDMAHGQQHQLLTRGTLHAGFSPENGMPVIKLCEWLTGWNKYHSVAAYNKPPKKKWYQKGFFQVLFVVIVIIIVIVVTVVTYGKGTAPAAKGGLALTKAGAAALAATAASVTLSAFALIAGQLGMMSAARFLGKASQVAGAVAAVLGVYASAQNFISQGTQAAINTSSLSASSASNLSAMPMTSSLYAQPAVGTLSLSQPATSSIMSQSFSQVLGQGAVNSITSGGITTTINAAAGTISTSSIGVAGTTFSSVTNIATGTTTTTFGMLGSPTTMSYVSNVGSMMNTLKNAFGLSKSIYSAYSQGKALFNPPNYTADPDMSPDEDEQEASRVNWALTWSGEPSLHKFINTKEVYDLGEQPGTLLYTPSVREKMQNNGFWRDDAPQEAAMFFSFNFNEKGKK